jgi:hypothetical protein
MTRGFACTSAALVTADVHTLFLEWQGGQQE